MVLTLMPGTRAACLGAGVGLTELTLTRLPKVGSGGADPFDEVVLAGRAFFFGSGTNGAGAPGKTFKDVGLTNIP